MGEVLREHGSRLPTVAGVGPVLASRLIGRTGKPSRFPSASAFANYVGVAPIELASGGRARHRLSRYGDRQLNAAIHYVALTQARMSGSPGRAYYDRKIAEGKTRNEAMRCLIGEVSASRPASWSWLSVASGDGPVALPW
jgi:transposase